MASYQSGDLRIDMYKVDSLDGCPQHVTGDFACDQNMLTSLVGGPQKVDGYYDCSGNQLTDLVGCASHIGGTLHFPFCDITSLVGIHKIIKSCKEVSFHCAETKEGGIGLLLIENLSNISDRTKPFEIIKSYLGTGTKGMMECRSELISSGYADYAKL